jgi:hypothetical protein
MARGPATRRIRPRGPDPVALPDRAGGRTPAAPDYLLGWGVTRR